VDKGTILFHSNLTFKDGQPGEKLLIILNTPADNEPYLCCKTTSKQKYGIDIPGCHSSKNIFVLEANSDYFFQRTYVQFHELYEFNKKEMLREHFAGNLQRKDRLGGNTINAIVNCVRKSVDVLKYHKELLR
jgi:hypothetical protein